MKRYSPAFERNRDPVLENLKQWTQGHGRVLEVGSGPGEHACYFAKHLPRLVWQPSDVEEYLPSITAWREEAALENLNAPLHLNLLNSEWSKACSKDFTPDFIFTMNVAHIVCYEGVVSLVEGAGRLLEAGGRLFFYGPWQFRNETLEPSNTSFDQRLQASIPGAGIREYDAVLELAQDNGFKAGELTRMPTNNCSFFLEKI